MTYKPSRRRAPVGALALVGSVLLVAVAACGSAEDLAGQAAAEQTPSATPTGPPASATPSPTPSPTPEVAAPKAGDCRSLEVHDLVTRVTRTTAEPVRCADNHNSQTYAVKPLSGKLKQAVTSDAEQKVYQAARGFCSRELRGWLKADRNTVERSQFAFVVGVPTSSDVSAGANWVRCDVYLRNGLTKMVKLPRSTKGALSGPRGDDYHSCVKGNIANASSTVPCLAKHKWRSVSSIKLGSQSKKWPGNKKIRGIVKKRCGDDVREYLNTSSSFRYGYISPTKRMWKRGERYGVCFTKTSK